MNKISTKQIKENIATWIIPQIERLCKEFVPEYSKKEFQTLTEKPSNWKRMCKDKSFNKIERIFDCKPFDDQLRLYVYTNLEDTEIISYSFHTE